MYAQVGPQLQRAWSTQVQLSPTMLFEYPTVRLLTAALRRALTLPLEVLHLASREGKALTDQDVLRAWKLFQLVSRLLLHKRPEKERYSKEELASRVRLFD